MIQAQFDNPDIKFVTPEEGLSLWSDNMLVPNLATHQANAEKWIDYYYEPEVAAKLAAWVNYICPVKGAQAGDGEDRPVAGRQPADLPRRRDARRSTFDFMPLTEKQITAVRRRVRRCHRWLSRAGRARRADDDVVRRARGCAA